MQPLQWGAILGASLTAAVWDVTDRRIPNVLTGALLLGGLVWATWVGKAWGLADSVVACLMLALPYVILFLFAGGGAGDAKLMGAIGAWTGVINGLVVLFAVAVAGIVLAVIHALVRRQVRATAAGVGGFFLRLLYARGTFKVQTADKSADNTTNPRNAMPYGLAILLGTAAAAVGLWIWRT